LAAAVRGGPLILAYCDIGLLNSVNAPEIARAGEQAALEVLPSIKKITSWQKRLARLFGQFLFLRTKQP